MGRDFWQEKRFDKVIGIYRGLSEEIQLQREEDELLLALQNGYYDSACRLLLTSPASPLVPKVKEMLVSRLTEIVYGKEVSRASQFVDLVASDGKADYIVLEAGCNGMVAAHLWPEGMCYSRPERASWNSRSVCGERIRPMHRISRGAWATHPQDKLCLQCACKASEFLETQEIKGHCVLPAHQEAELVSDLHQEISACLQKLLARGNLKPKSLTEISYTAFETVLLAHTYKRLRSGGAPLLERILYTGFPTSSVPEESLRYLSSDDWKMIITPLLGSSDLYSLRRHYSERLGDYLKGKQVRAYPRSVYFTAYANRRVAA